MVFVRNFVNNLAITLEDVWHNRLALCEHNHDKGNWARYRSKAYALLPYYDAFN